MRTKSRPRSRSYSPTWLHLSCAGGLNRCCAGVAFQVLFLILCTVFLEIEGHVPGVMPDVGQAGPWRAPRSGVCRFTCRAHPFSAKRTARTACVLS